ncbi:MAG: hypothetical protein KJP02_03735 [Octadecabacter sp.]|nr:hypothetical protein [Octadecabacter sp.]
MATTKRTFSIPEEISDELDAAIPSRERSKFIAITLQEALRNRKRQELMELLDALPRSKTPDGRLSEDILRDIRDTRAQDILDNSRQ